MVFDLKTVLFIFAAQLLAYSVKGLLGFGNPLISAPILSMRLDNMLITPGTLLMDCPVNAYIAWKNRASFNWRRVFSLLLAMMCGIVPGTLLLRFSLPWILKTLLGIVVVFLGLEMATRGLHPKKEGRDSSWGRLVVAFFAGMCSGLFGISMIIVAYLERTAKDYNEFKGSMCFLFLGENLFRLLMYLVTGLITKDALLFALITLPAVVLSMFLSSRLSRRLDQRKLRPAAIALFLLGGVSIIVKSILLHS